MLKRCTEIAVSRHVDVTYGQKPEPTFCAPAGAPTQTRHPSALGKQAQQLKQLQTKKINGPQIQR